tara:strand:- start:18992 stop:19312 length:321 start_codon:yes stop_codon:yes gene_type:complete
MFVIYTRLSNSQEVAPIPCKAIFDSGILGSDYMELHGVDERIKDNIMPKATINIMTIKKENIESIISFIPFPKKQTEEIIEPKEEPKKEEPKKKRKYVKSGKYRRK